MSRRKPRYGPFRRGIDTKTGEAGFCGHCMVAMPEGPDACLGILPNVSHACCGHGLRGRIQGPYVVVGGAPDQSCYGRDDYIVLEGPDALAFFASQGVGPPALERQIVVTQEASISTATIG